MASHKILNIKNQISKTKNTNLNIEKQYKKLNTEFGLITVISVKSVYYL